MSHMGGLSWFISIAPNCCQSRLAPYSWKKSITRNAGLEKVSLQRSAHVDVPAPAPWPGAGAYMRHESEKEGGECRAESVE